MRKNVVAGRSSIFCGIVFLFIALLVATAPVLGQVQSIRARVIERPEDIVTTRRANFQPGNILDTSLVSLTIRNGNEAAYVLLKLKIEFGDTGAWAGDYVQVSFVKKLESNTNFTFTNSDALSYMNIIRSNDFAMSDTLIEHTGITSINDIVNLKNIPEGIYEVSLTVSEITLSNPNDINSAYTIVANEWQETQASVEFKVVTIGSIGNIVVPTVDTPAFSFQVPEIPVYDDVRGQSTSRTTLTINGPGVLNVAASKSHKKSIVGSSAIKGYPSDTDGGTVVYDLSALPFRAGESYSATINFNDWDNASIATATKTWKFPTPKLTLTASLTDPFKPLLSWAFSGTDYYNWVLEYRIYLDNKYIGKTSDTNFQISENLTPATTYSWYVMPINKDTSQFFSSSAGLAQSFTTKAHSDLTVKIEEPKNGSILIVGETYSLKGSAIFFNGAGEKSSQWQLGTDTKAGLETTYTPGKRYPSNSMGVTLKVTDTLDLVKTTPSINFTVLQPAIAISGTATRTVEKSAQVPLAVDSQNTRDISTYEWFADGSGIGSGNQRTHSFTEKGEYDVYVAGTTVADVNGATKTIESSKIKVIVMGSGPAVSISQPPAGGEMALGSSVRIKATIENENSLSSTQWAIAGPDTSQSGASGSELLFQPRTAGEYTATITVIDEYQKQAKASVRILVIDPSISITRPTPNMVYALADQLNPSALAPNADRIVWSVDGNEINSNAYSVSQLGEGTYQLKATAFWNTIDVNGNPAEYSKDSNPVSFLVRDLSLPEFSIEFPRTGMTLMDSVQYQLSAEPDTINTRDGLQSWWIADGTRLSNARYAPGAGTSKTVAISYHVRTAEGLEGSKSVSVKVISPRATVSGATATNVNVRAGTVIPAALSVQDAKGFWIIDGVERSNWDKIFTEAGTYAVQAGWRADAYDSSGTIQEFSGESPAVQFLVYSDKPPVITGFSPSGSLVREAKGRGVEFSIFATSENPLATPAWQVLDNGTQIKNGTGYTFSHTFTAAGQFTVRATIGDAFGISTTKEWTVKVIDPSIAISYPTDGMTFALNAVPTPTASSQDLSSFRYLLDGSPVGSNFNWASVPVGNHILAAEGSYLVTSSSDTQILMSPQVSFNVRDSTPPRFEIEGIRDGDRIIAGQQYSLAVTRTGNETIQWFRNGSLVDGAGTQYSFTAPADAKSISFIVRGTLNGITLEKAFKVNVLNPYISILLPESLSFNNQYPSQTAIPLQTERRDIDRVEWSVDLRSYTDQTVSFAPGVHSISVKGFATGVRLPSGTYGEFQATGAGSTTREITVAERISILSVSANSSTIYTNDSIEISAEISNTALLSRFTYRIDGISVYQGKNTRVAASNLSAGRHTIRVEALDVFGFLVSAETTITVLQPLSVSITQPASGSRVSPDTNIFVAMTALSGQYSNLSWSIDGNPVLNSNFSSGSLGRLSSGSHRLSVNARDAFGRTAIASVDIEVQSDFQLSLVSPASGTTWIVGNLVEAMVGLEKFSGSSFRLDDASQFISWYVDGSDTGSKGLRYAYTPEAVGDHTIQAKYEKGDMLRTTPLRTIRVRDIAEPTILLPLNGANITYADGASIVLSARGEAGAIFSWMIDGLVVAMGSDATFSPNGLTGQKQVKLVTTASGRVKERMVTINLSVNSPPTLNFTAPATQFTGDILAWTASAFDVEDKTTPPSIEMYLDGVKLAEAGSRVLAANDIGIHTLAAKATDSLGSVTRKELSLRVESKTLPITVSSPAAGANYYLGLDLPLRATLAGQDPGAGVFTWTIQYLDDTAAQVESIVGSSTSIRPASLGDTSVTVGYTDANGRERGSTKFNVRIEREPLVLSIYWPHGNMVNAGEKLSPTLLGLPEKVEAAALSWTLNGLRIASIENLNAPGVPGPYTLVAQYSENGSAARAEVGFTVNAAPNVTILQPSSGSQHIAGAPIILSASVTDDQVYSGSLRWTTLDGSLVGVGQPFVMRDATIGERQTQASAVDRFGAEGKANISFRVYKPVSNIATLINNGIPTYLITRAGNPLVATVDFVDGIAPQATWTLKQEERSVVKTGKGIAFSFDELTTFAEGPALLNLVVTDAGIADASLREAYRQDFPVTLTKNAKAEIVSPIAGDLAWVGDPLSIVILLTGFDQVPEFSLIRNGAEISSPWIPKDGGTFETTIPAEIFNTEGIYEFTVDISADGLNRSLGFTVNVYQRRTGIFVDNAPTTIDLELDVPGVEATLSGLVGIDGIRWFNDLSAAAIGTGPSLNLGAAGLRPGDRSIRVEALSGSRVVAAHSFPLKVLGAMELTVLPESDPIIIQRGASVLLSATGRDRDGSSFEGAAITWTSHMDGVIGQGNILDFSQLDTISAGEHVLTIAAQGASGAIAILKNLQVNIIRDGSVGDQSGQDSDNDGESDGSEGDGSGDEDGSGFNSGSEIDSIDGEDDEDDPLGPGGEKPDPGLLPLITWLLDSAYGRNGLEFADLGFNMPAILA